MARRSRARRPRPEVLRRILVYGALLLILAAWQCSFFARLRFLPATPDLILCAVLAILLLDSPQAAAIAAVFGGFVIDALGGVGISWSPLLYLLTVASLSAWSAKMMKNLGAWLMLIVPSLLIRAAYDALRLWLSVDSTSWQYALRQLLLPKALTTLLLSVPIYGLVRLCMPMLGGHGLHSHR